MVRANSNLAEIAGPFLRRLSREEPMFFCFKPPSYT